MADDLSTPPRFGAARCLVRYVDSDQAVIETRYAIRDAHERGGADRRVSVQIDVTSGDGFHDTEEHQLRPGERRGIMRTELVRPDLWWPAGMGEQKLYDITASLLVGGVPIEQRSVCLGMASVRQHRAEPRTAPRYLLVNGQEFPIDHVIAIDEPDERTLLPIGGASLVIVRGHYGPDLLYDAADRAGVLLIQCVPIDPDGEPVRQVGPAVRRLASHPSLVGWYVGHLGPLAEPAEHTVRDLDPQHPVFHQLPAA